MGEYKLAYENASTIYQKIYTDRIDETKNESLQAKIKDPLWYLTRQWQFGEFLAESCGHPVEMEISYSELPISKVRHNNNTRVDYDTARPMEWYIEDEINGQKPVDWNDRSLEYSCDLEGAGMILHADEYYSGDLDWYDFIAEGTPDFSAAPVERVITVPTNVTYRGMPAVRYWAFEDGAVNFKSVERKDENILSTMLISFTQLFGEDWYIAPLEQKAGWIRKIKSVTIKDSFNNPYIIPPVVDNTSDGSLWSLFTLARKDGSAPDGSIFFLPNTISNLLESEDMEEVTFIRDEMMNMVWAVENRYEANELSVDRNDELAAKGDAGGKNQKSSLPQYIEMGEVSENWVPYIPVELNSKILSAGLEHDISEILLRRAKTAPVPGVPYKPTEVKGMIIRESTYLNEEEIPAFPISVVRKYNLVNLGRVEKWALSKDAAGKYTVSRTDAGAAKLLMWGSREKKPGKKTPSRDLKFDQVI